MLNTITYKKEIIDYYNTCWVERFKSGHNPKSRAMHMGYFDKPGTDNDDAKNKMNSFVAEHLELVAGEPKTIVDAGCGIGSTSLYLAENFTDLNIVGINISEQQIELAKEFITSKPGLKSEISFLCEDYANTTLEAGTVDIVYGIESICHAAVKEDFYNEAFRILKPGGTLLIIDYVQKPEKHTGNTRELMQVFKNGWAVSDYITGPEQELANTGFETISITSLYHQVMPGILNSYNGAVEKITTLNGSLPPRMKKHLEACIALKNLSDKGTIDYCLIKCTKPGL